MIVFKIICRVIWKGNICKKFIVMLLGKVMLIVVFWDKNVSSKLKINNSKIFDKVLLVKIVLGIFLVMF